MTSAPTPRDRTPSTWWRAWPYVALILLPMACAFRLVLDPSALLVDGQNPSLDNAQKIETPAVGNDLTRLFLPHHSAMARRVANHGHLPGWDPRGFGGRPAIGNPQGGLFYPPIWLAWRFWSPSALGWLTLAHLAFAGIGAYTLARASSLSVLASTIAGGIFEACPYVLGHVVAGHYPHVWAAACYPWAFLAASRARQGDWWGILSLPPVLAMAMLAGHPQPGYYLAITLGAWGLWDFHRSTRLGQRPRAFRQLATWAAIAAATAGLLAVEVAPDLASRSWGLRGGKLGLDDAGKYHLNPANLLQLLSPRALGAPANYFGHDNSWEAQLGLGWIPLVLAGLGVALSCRRDLVRGWGALLGGSLAFAAGWRLGLFAILYELLPGMNQLRAPGRALFLANLAAAMLAGLGVDALASALSSDWNTWLRRSRAIAIVAILTLFVVGIAAPEPTPLIPAASRTGRPVHRRAHPDQEFAIWGKSARSLAIDPVFVLALSATAGVLIWVKRSPANCPRAALALGALALAELAVHGAIALKASPSSRFDRPDALDADVARLLPEGGPWRIRARDAAYDDLRASRAGVEKTNIHDSFQLQHAADLYQALYPIFDPPGRSGVIPAEVRQAVLDRMGVALLITDRPDPNVPWPVVARGQSAHSAYFIHRNPTALPRAYVVPRAEVVATGECSRDRLSRIDPRAAVLLPHDPLARHQGPRQPFRPVHYRADDPDRVVVEATTTAPGLLVVADTWMPGWSAKLDGRPVSLLEGDLAHRVVVLPTAGTHQVVMTYQPPGAALGRAISTFTAFAWTLTGLVLLLAKGTSKATLHGRARSPIRPPLTRPRGYPIAGIHPLP